MIDHKRLEHTPISDKLKDTKKTIISEVQFELILKNEQDPQFKVKLETMAQIKTAMIANARTVLNVDELIETIRKRLSKQNGLVAAPLVTTPLVADPLVAAPLTNLAEELELNNAALS